MGVLAIVACVIVGLGVLFSISRRGTSQPAYAPVHYTNPSLPVSQSPAATTVVSDGASDTAGASDPSPQWQGEHFPQTRQGYLQQSDIQGWSYSGVRYALNEMYARHGYPFRAAPLRHQFQKFPWYHAIEGLTAANVEAQFTPAEHANQVLLAQQRNRLVQEGKAIR